MNLISSNIDQIRILCDRYHVRSLYAIGSVTRDALKPESDVDFVVDIQNDNPVSYSEDYFALKFQLEVLFKRAIDLLEEKAIKNPYLLESLNKTKVLVYGKSY